MNLGQIPFNSSFANNIDRRFSFNNPVDGQLVVYNSTTGKWVNGFQNYVLKEVDDTSCNFQFSANN